MPFSRMILPQRTDSLFTKAANSGCGLPTGSAPRLAICVFTASLFRSFASTAFSLATMSAGVFFGRKMPFQPTIS